MQLSVLLKYLELCSHHYYLISEYLYPPQRNPIPINNHSIFSHPHKETAINLLLYLQIYPLGMSDTGS